MSLLTACQTVLRSVRQTEVPDSIIGNENQTAKHILQTAKTELEYLSDRADWTILQAEHTFTTTVAFLQTGGLPSDYGHIISQSVWNRTTEDRVFGPLTPQQWQKLQADGIVASVDKYFRIFGNGFYLWPAPTVTTETIAFEYISSDLAQTAAGAAKETFTLDTDTSRVSENLLYKGMLWRYLKDSGLPYQEEFNDYERSVERAMARDGGAPVYDLAGEERPYPVNIPDSNFG